jgi:hypothetical protein
MTAKVDQIRDIVRQHAERHGIQIEQLPNGAFHLHGLHGFVDFKVRDLADVDVKDLAPNRKHWH